MIYLLQNSYFWRKNSKLFLDDNSYLISYHLILTKTHNTKKVSKEFFKSLQNHMMEQIEQIG